MNDDHLGGPQKLFTNVRMPTDTQWSQQKVQFPPNLLDLTGGWWRGRREWLAGREKVQAINIEKILAHVRKRLFAELWWWGRELRMVHKSDISLQLPSSFGGQKEIYEAPCQRNGFFLLNPPEIMSTWSFEGLSLLPLASACQCHSLVSTWYITLNIGPRRDH